MKGQPVTDPVVLLVTRRDRQYLPLRVALARAVRLNREGYMPPEGPRNAPRDHWSGPSYSDWHARHQRAAR
jgi:hypothetical protein